MDLALTESEQLLRNSVRQFVRQEATIDTLTNLEPPRTWIHGWLRTLADAGWLGMFVPQEYDGSGATAMEAAVIMEELGRGPVPSPMLPSSVVAALLLRHLSGDPREELLRGIARGTHVVIPALREPDRSWEGAGTATAQISEAQLTATKLFVSYADAATHFLVSLAATPAGAPQFAVIPADADGVSIRPLGGFLHASHEVTFEGVPVGGGQVLTGATPEALDEALAPGLIALGAYQVGGCASVLDMSISYANTREQFGTPIGRFQRVQDHIIRILNATDMARWACYEAAWATDTRQPASAARAHLAAAAASESYLEAVNAGHEVHAGIGSDPKFGLTLYTQQSRSLYEMLGTPDWHRARMAEGLAWAS